MGTNSAGAARVFVAALALSSAAVLAQDESKLAAGLRGDAAQRFEVLERCRDNAGLISVRQLVAFVRDPACAGRSLALALLVRRVLEDGGLAAQLVEELEARPADVEQDVPVAECLGMASPPPSETALRWIGSDSARLQALGFVVLCRAGAPVARAQQAINRGLQSDDEGVATWAARACGTLRTYTAETPLHLARLSENGAPRNALWAVWALDRTSMGTAEVRALARVYDRERRRPSSDVDLVGVLREVFRAPSLTRLQRVLSVLSTDAPTAEKAAVLDWLGGIEVRRDSAAVAARLALARSPELAAPALRCLGRFAPRDDALRGLAVANLAHEDPAARREAYRLVTAFSLLPEPAMAALRRGLHEEQDLDALAAAVFAWGVFGDDEDEASWDRVRSLWAGFSRGLELRDESPRARLAAVSAWALHELRPESAAGAHALLDHVDTPCRMVRREVLACLNGRGRSIVPVLAERVERGERSDLLALLLHANGEAALARRARPAQSGEAPAVGLGVARPDRSVALASGRRSDHGAWLQVLDGCLLLDPGCVRRVAGCPEPMRPVAAAAVAYGLLSTAAPRTRAPLRFPSRFGLTSERLRFSAPILTEGDPLPGLHVRCCEALGALGAAARSSAGILEYVSQVGDPPVAAAAKAARERIGR